MTAKPVPANKAAAAKASDVRIGALAFCAQGRLGLITSGPTPMAVAGEKVELWSGVHLTSGKTWVVGGGWASYRPTVVGHVDELLARKP